MTRTLQSLLVPRPSVPILWKVMSLLSLADSSAILNGFLRGYRQVAGSPSVMPYPLGRREPLVGGNMSLSVSTDAPTSAAAAANEFLSLAWGETGNASVPPTDQMKLQKLLFYAHAWHLAMHGRPLFDEDFEAWPWGPVVRDVYNQTRAFGRAPINRRIQRLQVNPVDPLNSHITEPAVVDQATRGFIWTVWQSHKQFSGVQLSNSTHDPGEPWTIVRDTVGSLDNKPSIPNELIEQVFKNKLGHATQRA